MEWTAWLIVLAICAGVGRSLLRAPTTMRPQPRPEPFQSNPGQPVGMTPADFRREVLPLVIAAWERACFCRNAGFQRMTALDLGPNALADAQILIHHIVEQHFVADGPWQSDRGEQTRSFHCPQCACSCTVVSEDFSINMSRSYLRWVSMDGMIGAKSPYLVGFYGFDPPQRLDGFRRVSSPADFVAELTRAS